ncbi:MAG: hypothetical protein AAF797_14015 [Planctomycetota bacterium]
MDRHDREEAEDAGGGLGDCGDAVELPRQAVGLVELRAVDKRSADADGVVAGLEVGQGEVLDGVASSNRLGEQLAVLEDQ